MKKLSILFLLLGLAVVAVSCENGATGADYKGLPASAGPISGPGTIYAGYSLTLTVDQIDGATTYKWYKEDRQYQNSRSRELTVTEPGVYRVAGVNGFGEGKSSPEKTVVVSAEAPLIDRIVGKWNATEYIANPRNNSVGNNDHVVTIKKVNGNTVEISNFTWRNYPDPNGEGDAGDTLKARIDNEAGTLYILPPAQFLPSWVTDYATLLSPAYSLVPGENSGYEFPLQTIAEDASSGKLRIVFKTGDLTKDILDGSTTITVPITYIVTAVQLDIYAGSLAYYLDTVWTKQ